MRTLFSGIIAFSALGLASTGLSDFLPPNDLHLEDNLEFSQGVTEEEFNAIIEEAKEIYTPIVRAQGGRLSINANWGSSTVNASASQFFGTWRVNMYGGLARRPEVTADGFAFVVCHELGHHLAGFTYSSSWAANEGQSDYFASQSCGRILWGDDLEKNAEAADLIPDYPKTLCDTTYFAEGQDRRNLCYRQMLASFSISSLLGALKNDTVTYDTPDRNVVSRTSNSHPDAQCRMDTYMAGTLCQAEFDVDLIPSNEREAAEVSCHQAVGYKEALRPRCWFKPKLN